MQRLKKNLATAVVVFVLGAVAWFVVIYKPKREEVLALAGKIKELTLQVEGLLAQDHQISITESEIDSLKRTITDLEIRIYQKERFPEMAKLIEERGKEYGLHFSTIAPDYDALLRLDAGQRDELGPLVILPVTFAVQGDFIRFGRFTESLHALPFLFSISQLHVEATAESYPEVKANMDGVLFLTETGEEPAKPVAADIGAR
jgi:Tfp pilus assembly protein PilO